MLSLQSRTLWSAEGVCVEEEVEEAKFAEVTAGVEGVDVSGLVHRQPRVVAVAVQTIAGLRDVTTRHLLTHSHTFSQILTHSHTSLN